MSENEQGPWKQEDLDGHCVTDANQFLVADCASPEIARRVAACLNACAGISTDNLEDNVPVKELARRYNATIRVRDQLLAAAKATTAAHGSLFQQCCSNPITNAWGKTVDMSLINEAVHLAGAAIAAVEQQP